ncbi:CmpA/NrtA family ABC transporter substrate-binding protein [Leptothoe sp. PORK10 BA2]|uniref:CmpA/NrtA family ABC transporter substrate-binding protein n=1 Tax=Leptothoe sp. PORK10 BA2 TaxID=3110254 RepID=UPI002B207658|nr:CmpA/NrtA family ABC transporter substrate-binding protein [Leptothoe sp. PORK10 BA2]MEA5463538.1 CmpA/NrtA family ABC transporter substrate-binding protein [Leptothoe sp. PORK10 BA2]
MSKISRRKFIVTSGTATAAALLVNACAPNSETETDTEASAPTEAAAPISAEDAPEVTAAKLGFIALTDSAPLIIAKEKGLFDKYGMTEVEVLKQASWPVTRDNMELGSEGGGIDGAHILTPMPYMMALGTITKAPLPMYILARLNVNGQGISLSNEYLDLKVGTDSSKMKEVFAKAQASKKELNAAMTFPGGTHDLWLRYWLAAGGINPESDISVVPVPPPQMVANMKIGTMETFCVGEPWNAQLVNQKQGYSALVTGELWKNHPEKAFAMRADWVDANPKAAKAMLKAVLEAQQWCDNPENHQEMCEIVSQNKWFKVPVEDILSRIQGKIDYGDGRTVEDPDISMKFWKDNASYPYKSHDLWFLTEDIRWGYIPADTDTKSLVDQVNRSDLWKEAAEAIGVAAGEIPTSDSRGVETFFDGVKFDPEDPKAYLDGLKIKKI